MKKTVNIFYLASLLLLPLALFAQSSEQSVGQSFEQYDVDQTTGFRMERYRAPVPADIPDANTLTIDAALALHNGDSAIFIDVYPPKGLGPDPLEGYWVTNEQRQSIPGSVWLPEVGRGTLQPDAHDYFVRNLKRLSNNNKNIPLVFFCTSDCWQSWNASRRASMLGYTNVNWFPLGSDGWLENNQALTRVYPLNFFDDTLDIPDKRGG